MIFNRIWVGVAVLVGIAAPMTFTTKVRGQASNTAPQYTADGQLKLPAGFETWVFVGSNLALGYKDEAPANTQLEATRPEQQQFHNVYINPEAYAYFLANKEFPDKTVLVMDVFNSADREPKHILKSGFYNGQHAGVQVAVKNLSRPDGKTTPWAYYTLMNPFDPSPVMAPSAPAHEDGDCYDCHKLHAGKDNVWVQFYPTLRKLIQ
ncbi:cytochrome P460 family protein [uncultured Bradyrhizobium sp.]|uniref:cytochrome P460 family protein n=1 Tax=uncultured Bradyrhizobium sp. TaxID=199684 RepID=UPI0035CC52AB